MAFLYTIELFGRLRVRRHVVAAAEQPDRIPTTAKPHAPQSADIERFRTQKTGALFAYLGYFGDRKHARDVLTEMFWPDVVPAAARHNLSMAVSSLRAQFEPAPLAPGSVLYADRLQIGVMTTVTTDVARFEQLLDAVNELTATSPDRLAMLAEATGLYRSDLLPGYYEAWIVPEQERLAERFRGALLALAEAAAVDGKPTQAIRYARRAVESDPLDEEAQALLERLGGAAADEDQEDTDDDQFQSKSASRRRPKAQSGLHSDVERTGSRWNPETAAEGSRLGSARTSPDRSSPASAQASSQVRTSSSSLLVSLTRFFGREIEGRMLLELLADPEARLITIAGPGGVGKTRLAQETLRRLDEASAETAADSGNILWLRKPSPDHVLPRLLGAVDVTLLHPGDIQGQLKAISEAVGLSYSTGTNTAAGLSAISEVLRKTIRPLLMLDNLESIMPDGANTIARLLSLAPNLKFLVTSRIRVGVAGEAVFDLEPLPTPLALTNLEAAEVDISSFARQWAGVALFVDRAQQVRPDFTLTPRNIRAIVRVVHFLEGLPLALELAAARIQLLSPSALLGRLRSNRFDLLTGSSRRFGKRHASLQATIAWSVEYLAPEVRQFLAELSVFSGGFSVESAEKLTACPLALDYLAELCDASLVRTMGQDASSQSGLPGAEREDTTAVNVRFHQLETVRAFTQTLLSSEQMDVVRLRHAQIYVQMACGVGPRLEGGNPGGLLDEMDAERANLRSAMEWLLPSAPLSGESTPTSETALSALRLASEIYRYWLLRGDPLEGLRWLESAIQATMPDLSESDFSKIESEIGVQQFFEAAGSPIDTRADGRTARIPVPTAIWATAVNRLGVLAMTMGDIGAAERSFGQALTLRRLLGQTRGIAAALGNLSILSMQQGHYDSARRYGEEGLRLWREVGDAAQIATALANLGAMAHEAGDLVLAERLLRESIDDARRLDDVHSEAVSRCNLGEVLMRSHRLREAEVEFRAFLTSEIPLQATASIAHGLLDMGLLRTWMTTYPEPTDALANRLRATARHYLTASRIPSSAFIEQQELRCFGPWDSPTQRTQRRLSPAEALEQRRLSDGDPIRIAGNLPEDSLENSGLLEQEVEAAGRAVLLLANLIVNEDFWYASNHTDAEAEDLRLSRAFSDAVPSPSRESA